jgi:hypothetical protein
VHNSKDGVDGSRTGPVTSKETDKYIGHRTSKCLSLDGLKGSSRLVKSGIESATNLCQKQGFNNSTILSLTTGSVGSRIAKSGGCSEEGLDSIKVKRSNKLAFRTDVSTQNGGDMASTANGTRLRPGKSFTRNNYWTEKDTKWKH